ncbi:Holliday junction resolvase RuvX [Elusimicrobiota bacterium]
MKLLGIDYGSKRIGIAISDPLGIAAHPITIIQRKSLKADMESINRLITENSVSKIVMGLPINMDGTEGSLTSEIKSFAQKITEATKLPVDFHDERLTSSQTERILVDEADVSRNKRKDIRDKVAASIMLQSYLDTHK